MEIGFQPDYKCTNSTNVFLFSGLYLSKSLQKLVGLFSPYHLSMLSRNIPRFYYHSQCCKAPLTYHCYFTPMDKGWVKLTAGDQHYLALVNSIEYLRSIVCALQHNHFWFSWFQRVMCLFSQVYKCMVGLYIFPLSDIRQVTKDNSTALQSLAAGSTTTVCRPTLKKYKLNVGMGFVWETDATQLSR